jgi:hypothetical protein
VNVSRYVGLIPKIEEWLRLAKLDTLVLGLGPTAWLARYVRRDLLRDIRMFGPHDVWRILPVSDLVLMDTPASNHGVLGPDGERHATIVASRPERLWIYTPNIPEWDPYIHACMRPVIKPVQFTVWDVKQASTRSDFRIGETQPGTMMVSPTGCTTLAWHQGCRRIGVLGMDMMPGHHHTGGDPCDLSLVDLFMCKIAQEAQAKGGAILNLSPITSLAAFKQASESRLIAP